MKEKERERKRKRETERESHLYHIKENTKYNKKINKTETPER